MLQAGKLTKVTLKIYQGTSRILCFHWEEIDLMIDADEGKNVILSPGSDFKGLFSTRELIGVLRQECFTYEEAKNWNELTTYGLISIL